MGQDSGIGLWLGMVPAEESYRRDGWAGDGWTGERDGQKRGTGRREWRVGGEIWAGERDG